MQQRKRSVSEKKKKSTLDHAPGRRDTEGLAESADGYWHSLSIKPRLSVLWETSFPSWRGTGLLDMDLSDTGSTYISR